MSHDDSLVILLDVDNTLLDNDTVKADLDRFIGERFGDSMRERFWVLYEEVRKELDAVNFAVVMERLHHEAPSAHVFSQLTDFLMHYPYRKRLYPGALTAIRHLRRYGVPVILSDGDPWFQAKKVADAGISAAVGGHVLIFTHKEDHLGEVRRWYPAEHYVFVDDKPRLVAKMKARMGDELTAVWVNQGSYAREGWGDLTPCADLVLDSIDGARWLTHDQLLGREPGPVRIPRRARRVPAVAP
jgi:FMN phosphatase YigB (HAD superfamily)